MGVKYWTDLERLERGESGFGGLILIHLIIHPAPKERRERKSEREKLTEKLRKQAANDRTIVLACRFFPSFLIQMREKTGKLALHFSVENHRKKRE